MRPVPSQTRIFLVNRAAERLSKLWGKCIFRLVAVWIFESLSLSSCFVGNVLFPTIFPKNFSIIATKISYSHFCPKCCVLLAFVVRQDFHFFLAPRLLSFFHIVFSSYAWLNNFEHEEAAFYGHMRVCAKLSELNMNCYDGVHIYLYVLVVFEQTVLINIFVIIFPFSGSPAHNELSYCTASLLHCNSSFCMDSTLSCYFLQYLNLILCCTLSVNSNEIPLTLTI